MTAERGHDDAASAAGFVRDLGDGAAQGEADAELGWVVERGVFRRSLDRLRDSRHVTHRVDNLVFGDPVEAGDRLDRVPLAPVMLQQVPVDVGEALLSGCRDAEGAERAADLVGAVTGLVADLGGGGASLDAGAEPGCVVEVGHGEDGTRPRSNSDVTRPWRALSPSAP